MMIRIVLFITILTFTGCVSATMVNYPGRLKSSDFAPTNESGRPGMIKYLNQGAELVRKSRREDAYRQMSAACGGKYKILTEGPNAEGGAISPLGSGYLYSQTQYWYISFQCEN